MTYGWLGKNSEVTEMACRDGSWNYGLIVAAVRLASEVHKGQVRKGSDTPYVSHLLGVAELVMEYGGDDVEAAAALLHDVVEDGGGAKRLDDVTWACGRRVAEIVEACSDSKVDTNVEAKKPWPIRKREYIDHVGAGKVDPGALLVSACDKLHNLSATRADFDEVGAEVWTRFKTGGAGQVWYYRELLKQYTAFGDRRVQVVAGKLRAELGALEDALEKRRYSTKRAEEIMNRFVVEDTELQLAAEALREDIAALADHPLATKIITQMKIDCTDPELLSKWGTSSAVEDGHLLIPEGLVDEIARQSTVLDQSRALHAGLLHTYGYLLSDVATKHGYKRSRWVAGYVDRAFGARDLIRPIPASGTLLANVTKCLEAVIHGPYSTREASGTHVERLVERSCGDEPVMRTYIATTTGERPILVYTVDDTAGAERLMTDFDVSPSDAVAVRQRAGTGEDRPIRLRYNATVPGVAVGRTWDGSVVLEPLGYLSIEAGALLPE